MCGHVTTTQHLDSLLLVLIFAARTLVLSPAITRVWAGASDTKLHTEQRPRRWSPVWTDSKAIAIATAARHYLKADKEPVGVSPDIDAATTTASGMKLLLPWIPKVLVLLSLGNHLVENLPEMTAVHDLPAFPCILDVKLGTVLYDEDGSPEKKERMIHTAASTTSLSTDVRLTGFQVYANDHPLPKLTPKNYDQTNKPEHPDGIVRFFPFFIPVSPSCMNVLPSADVVAAPDNIQPGLPPCTVLVLLTRLLESLERLRVALATAEVLIEGGSILIVYEGDWASAEKAARISEDVSIPTGKATASGKDLDGNAQGAPDEEGEDAECCSSVN
ncbi:hypothetical protein PISMIDRAFT_17592 [Pisolithus microcarpus 441]|uniref:Kinase n=1 Tax=Pisolithus microcarpus 441 TaxID=765257 RepID=A0A0C9XNN5_9AGAM|nr:hypothetical protein PISMIDRAFT_17592 [Pisolithus microcarpus 441]